jgi:hypothetical protein
LGDTPWKKRVSGLQFSILAVAFPAEWKLKIEALTPVIDGGT